mgnify:CR=1 FL=1|jgi:hypothetical protein
MDRPNETAVRPGVELTNRGPYVSTWTGTKFHIADPRPDEIFLQDIAHALGNTCRFGGHTVRFYSVAEHCIRMSWAMDWNHEWAVWALMHDAAEAYIGDLPSPVKQLLPEFSQIEDKIMDAVVERFDLPGAQIPAEVKRLDLAMCVAEYDALMGNSTDVWPNMPQGARGQEFHNRWGSETYGTGAAFLARAAELGIADPVQATDTDRMNPA